MKKSKEEKNEKLKKEGVKQNAEAEKVKESGQRRGKAMKEKERLKKKNE